MGGCGGTTIVRNGEDVADLDGTVSIPLLKLLGLPARYGYPVH